jgi:hypothetical protein
VFGEIWKWCHVKEIIDFGSHVVRGTVKRLWHENSMRWAGNRLSGFIHETHIDMKMLLWASAAGINLDYNGKILKIEAVIGKVYNGGSASANIQITKAAGATSIMKINTLQAGRRVMDEFGAQGSRTGDDLTTYANMTGFITQLNIFCWNNAFGTISDVTDPALPEGEIIITWAEF